MPRIGDRAEIRAVLETDRPWAVYALGDLAPGFYEHCEWFRAPGEALALALLYHAFDPPVLFTLGKAERLAGLMDEVGGERELYLSIRPDVLPLVRRRYSVRNATAMWRMIVDPTAFRSVGGEGVERLGPADLPALRRLYADGDAAGEAPDFFYPSMVEQGVFCGIREGEVLIAAAGTHLVSVEESVGAVGNVYTRRDRRGRGLARRVTGAVTAELLRMGIRTIALNVNQQNAAAVGVYERLGYRKYCAFCEGIALRRRP